MSVKHGMRDRGEGSSWAVHTVESGMTTPSNTLLNYIVVEGSIPILHSSLRATHHLGELLGIPPHLTLSLLTFANPYHHGGGGEKALKVLNLLKFQVLDLDLYHKAP